MAESDNSQRTQASEAITKAEQELVVRCLLMPFYGMNVLMPNTAVAEVIAYEAPRPVAQAPAWLKGVLPWRGRSVPVVSLENIIGLPEGSTALHARLIIFNTMGNSSAYPFVAMVAQGIPRLMALKEANVHYLPGEQSVEPGIYARLLLDGNAVVIPDLELIEKMLLHAGVNV